MTSATLATEILWGLRQKEAIRKGYKNIQL